MAIKARGLYVGLDVGGTTMKAAVVDAQGVAAPSINMPTEPEKGQAHGLETMCESIRRAVAIANRKLEEIAGIGVATPGTMDIAAGIILDPPNLKPWQNVPVKQHIFDTFRIPTAFQNDANAAAYGEFWTGAGREVQSMVLFTLGTGIGGGIIIDDKVLEGRHSHGGELGHMKIECSRPRQCGCGRLGCLEAYASATSVVARTREALEVPASSRLPSSLDNSINVLSSRLIFAAAEAGDGLASRIVEETAWYLAVGATNLMHIIDPDAVVFAGGMTAAGDSFLNRIRHYIHELAFPVPAARTLIRYARLGSDAGMIGAAACARYLVEGRLN